MAIGYSTSLGFYKSYDNSFTTGVTMYPQMKNASNTEKYAIQRGSDLVLTKQDSKLEELIGWLFLKHLTSFESSLLITKYHDSLPTRIDVLSSTEYEDLVEDFDLDHKKVFEVAVNQSEYLFVESEFYTTNNSYDVITTLIDQILYDQQNYPVSTALEDAFEKLNN